MKALLGPLVIGIGCTLLSLTLYLFDASFGRWMSLIEYRLYDFRIQKSPPPLPPNDPVMLVHIGQSSIDSWQAGTAGEIGWPWPREFYSHALRAASKSKVVAFDLLFEATSARTGNDDEVFAEGLKRHSRAVLAYMMYSGSTTVHPGLAGEGIPVTGAELLDPRRVPQATGLGMMVPGLQSSCRGTGSVAASTDEDGVVRRYRLLTCLGGKYYPSLGLRCLMILENVTSVGIEPGLNMRVGTRVIPIDDGATMAIRYYGDRFTIPNMFIDPLIVSGDLLADAERRGLAAPSSPLPIAPEQLADKILIVGTTAPGLMDHVSTPTASGYPGAEVHATALLNVLQGHGLRPANRAVTLALIVVLSLAGAWVYTRANIYVVLAVFGVVLCGIFLAGFTAFRMNSILEMFPPIFATMSTFIISQIFNYLTEGRRRHAVTRTFKRYVAPQVVNELLKNPELVDMLGSRKRLTILFLDFQGFTALSERMDPRELMELLNMYHREGVAAIFETEGTFDKFVGDAIVAYWGAPIDQEDQAVRACRAAVAIQKRLRALHAAASNDRVFRARIGLNTGECIWGNVGQGIMQNISIIGDEVNLASRLEGANKAFGTSILISESTYQEAKDRVVVREIGPIRVVGKQKPVRVYELMGMKGEHDGALAASYAEAWAKFYARDFQGAERIFSRFDDKLSLKCTEACRKLIEQPPDDAWEFVIDVESK